MSLRKKLLGRSGVEIVADGTDGVEGSIIVTTKGNEAKIGYLSVKPQSSGKGVGQELLSGAERWASEKGAGEIKGKLIPIPGSEKAVHGLFTKNGYDIDSKGNISKKLR